MADGNATPAARLRSHPFAGLQWGWRRKLPVTLQTEAAECGLACLAMVARYHGHDVDLAVCNFVVGSVDEILREGKFGLIIWAKDTGT